jgi:3-oxoacyl-[acyl-carrier-protein] synthase-1
MNRAYFLGAGIHTRLGKGVARNVERLLEPLPAPTELRMTLGEEEAVIPALLLSDTSLDNVEQRLWTAAETVIEEALDAAALSPEERREAALLIGTSSVDISITEAVYKRELAEGRDAHPLTNNSSIGALADGLRRRFGLRGPDYTISTACTASANALIYGDALVRSGRVRHAVVVGLEVFNSVTALGFHSLSLLARDGMKPFDAARGGLVLGEGCSALVIGAENSRENAFHLRGGANLCDVFGMSAANPDGSTVATVIRQALDAANVSEQRIAGVKTHGTASLLNDEAEAAGMRLVFSNLPQLCALKPFIGHTFGACGLNELVLFCGLAERGYFPATPGVCAEPGDLDIRLHQKPAPIEPGVFLLDYFGFGGNNSALVIANVEH